MEHALRYHIRKHFEEDPERFEKLSERLNAVLEELEGQCDAPLEQMRKMKTTGSALR